MSEDEASESADGRPGIIQQMLSGKAVKPGSLRLDGKVLGEAPVPGHPDFARVTFAWQVGTKVPSGCGRVLWALADCIAPHRVDSKTLHEVRDFVLGRRAMAPFALAPGHLAHLPIGLIPPPLFRLASSLQQAWEVIGELDDGAVLVGARARDVARWRKKLLDIAEEVPRACLKAPTPEQAHRLLDKVEAVLAAEGYSKPARRKIAIAVGITFKFEATEAARKARAHRTGPAPTPVE